MFQELRIAVRLSGIGANSKIVQEKSSMIISILPVLGNYMKFLETEP